MELEIEGKYIFLRKKEVVSLAQILPKAELRIARIRYVKSRTSGVL